jgi:repressor LexA
MKGLTKRQQEILDFIKLYLQKHQYPPTIREIAERFQISVKGSYDHIKALEKKQVIKCDLNRSRAITLVGESGLIRQSGYRDVPLLGSVAAGKPLFAEENMEGSVKLPVDYTSRGRHFALRVKGDSMKNAGILDGDIAVVRHQNDAENGNIVVALVDEAVTLKRFFLEKNRAQLRSENPAFPPIYTQDIRILGKLSFLIRHYE